VATKAPEIPEVTDLSKGYGAEWFGNSDNRQQSPELAAWLVASAAAIGIAGVNSITFFEERGPRGIESAEGDAYQVYAAVKELSELVGGNLLAGESPDGLLWEIGSGSTVLVANLRGETAQLEIEVNGATKTVDLPAYAWQKLVF
jgi:hypothetical protein